MLETYTEGLAMRRVLALLNIFALVLLGIGVVNVNKQIDLEGTIYSLSALIRERIQHTESLNTALIGETASVSQAAEAVVPIYVYEETPIYQGGHGSRFRFLQNFTTSVQVGSGTAFFITEDGYMLTNKHVVANTSAKYTVNLPKVGEVPLEVVYRDPAHDLAVVKVSGADYPVISLADSSDLRMGQNVTGIGNAFGEFNDSISSGRVSGLNRIVMVSDKDGRTERMRGLIQTSARLYPGDSGGPLLNEYGQAVGVNVASAVGEEVSFSIPINIAKRVMAEAGI